MTGEPQNSEQQQQQHDLHAPDERQRRWEAQRLSRMSQEPPQQPGHLWGGSHWASQLSFLDGSDALLDGDSSGASEPDEQAAAAQQNGARPTPGQAAAGAAASPSGSSGSGRSRPATAGTTNQGASLEERLSPADYQAMLREAELDCRGWSLVVTGHSLGAAVAALVGMHFRSWAPGERAAGVHMHFVLPCVGAQAAVRQPPSIS